MSPSTTPTPPPSREQLQGSLRELNSQLERTPTLNDHSRRTLQTLLAEMHRLVHRHSPVASAQPGAAERESTMQRLEALAVTFEAEHPLIAGTLREFIELCSSAGL